MVKDKKIKIALIAAIVLLMIIISELIFLLIIAGTEKRCNESILEAEKYFAAGNYNAAAEQLDKAIAADNRRADAWVAKINVQVQNKDFNGAVETLEELVSNPVSDYKNADSSSLQECIFDVISYAEGNNIPVSNLKEEFINNNWGDDGFSVLKTSKEFGMLNTVNDEIVFDYDYEINPSFGFGVTAYYNEVLHVENVQFINRKTSIYQKADTENKNTEIVNDKWENSNPLWYDGIIYYVNKDEKISCYDTYSGKRWSLPVSAAFLRYIVNDNLYLTKSDYVYRLSVRNIREAVSSRAFVEHPTEVFHAERIDSMKDNDIVIGEWQYCKIDSKYCAKNSVTGEIREFGKSEYNNYWEMYDGYLYCISGDTLYEVDGLSATVIKDVDIHELNENPVNAECYVETAIKYIDDNYIYIGSMKFNNSPSAPYYVYRADKETMDFVKVYESTSMMVGEG